MGLLPGRQVHLVAGKRGTNSTQVRTRSRTVKKIITVAALKVLLIPTAAGAECQTHACKVRVAHRQAKVKKLRTIRPYRQTFLGPVGACESGTGSYSLRVGLHAVSPGGTYRGRYQFGLKDWIA